MTTKPSLDPDHVALRAEHGLEFTVNGDGELTHVTVHGRTVWTCGKLASPSLRKALAEVKAKMAELETQLAYALDAASKGDAARLQAGGMELQIQKLEASVLAGQRVIEGLVTEVNEADRRAGAAERRVESLKIELADTKGLLRVAERRHE